MIAFILANSAGPDEMSHLAFHPGLHCFPNNLFTGVQNEMDHMIKTHRNVHGSRYAKGYRHLLLV